MKFNSKNRILAFVILGTITMIGVYQVVKDNSDADKIKGDPRHAVAEIVKQEANPKSKGMTLTYAFSEGNTTYVGKAEYKPLTQAGDSLTNHYFPLVYFHEDPNVNQLLIVAADFKKFGLVQPDSLKRHNALIE